MLQFLFGVLALAFVVQSLWSLYTSSFNFGVLLMVAFAAFFLLLAVFYRPLCRFVHTPVGTILRVLVCAGGLVFLLLLGFVAISGYLNRPTGNEQAMVVLGAGLRGDKVSRLLKERLDEAYAYYCEHPQLVIVTTGGQGRTELCPEGAAMKKYLVEKGVPEQQIISEEKSTSTEENFSFAKTLLAERGIGSNAEVVYVTNAFHCYRAGRYAAMAGFEHTTALPAGIPLTGILPCYFREVFALLFYWFFKSSRTGFMHAFVGVLALNKRYFYK